MSHADRDGTAVDDPAFERTYVDWPEGTEVSTVEELANLLGRDVDDIDDWIHGALAEDPGDVQVERTDDSIAIMTLAGRVTMWVLEFPFTKDQFDAYLIECDDRTTIAKCLMSFPTEEEWREDGQATIVPELADLCCASAEEFVAALGYRWEPIDLDWMGGLSEPVVYLLWNGRYIVGLDDCNLHVWSPANPNADPDEYEYGDPTCFQDIWDESQHWGGPTVDSFVRMLSPDIRPPRSGALPPRPTPPKVLAEMAARADRHRVRGNLEEFTDDSTEPHPC